MNWRVSFIFIIICALGAAIISRLFFVQVINRKLYESQALGQRVTFNAALGPRGQIFCENSQETKGAKGSGEVKGLALEKPEWTLLATNSQIVDKEAFAKALGDTGVLEKGEVLDRLQSGEEYVTLAKELAKEKIDKIKQLNLKGLYWQEIAQRFYPQGHLASQVLGFVGGAGQGQYGVEGYYEDMLKGKPGIQQNQRGLESIFAEKENISLSGSDIYLTLDYNIQFQAEQLLKKAAEKLDMDSGQIIVMKPDSGRIIAMADYPSFDPNNYSKTSLIVFQNSSVQKLFEPGSIMKPFTIAMALNEGKITSDSTYIDTGVLKYGDKSIHNFGNEIYGKQTMAQVLENSINTGAVYAAELLPHKTFFDYIYKFGFTQKTGIDLQGEVYSANSRLENGYPVNYATASFGQGIELTPMQIAKAFCALANGGKIVKPFIVEKIVNNKDELYTKPEISSPIVSQQALSQLNKMLIGVVEKGFNKVAKIPGYYLAGKTGTAQVPLKGSKGYDADKTIQSFIGYGPATNPQFLILVKLDDPKVSKSALSAVPVFKELAQYIINYWQIPPDYDPAAKK